MSVAKGTHRLPCQYLMAAVSHAQKRPTPRPTFTPHTPSALSSTSRTFVQEQHMRAIQTSTAPTTRATGSRLYPATCGGQRVKVRGQGFKNLGGTKTTDDTHLGRLMSHGVAGYCGPWRTFGGGGATALVINQKLKNTQVRGRGQKACAWLREEGGRQVDANHFSCLAAFFARTCCEKT